MSDDEILDIVQAHKEGKKIEYRELYLRENGRWITADIHDLWDFRNRRYRVTPDYISGYCFVKDIHLTPHIGMIKVRQVELEKGENPVGRKPREWKVVVGPGNVISSEGDFDTVVEERIRVREVLENE